MPVPPGVFTDLLADLLAISSLGKANCAALLAIRHSAAIAECLCQVLDTTEVVDPSNPAAHLSR